MKEKRDTTRYNISNSDLSCRLCREDDRADVCDISGAGLGMLTDQRLREGEMVELEIMVPGDDIPIFVRAEVTWTSRNRKAEGKYSNGLCLRQIHSSDKKRLLSFIHHSFIRLSRGRDS
ncbi:MAG: hypothetical protein GF392_00640 [Candidatus Omnitrophica bacterium]|nr:hypothetical protein [Candidatus Omnitrophota bacterium]